MALIGVFEQAHDLVLPVVFQRRLFLSAKQDAISTAQCYLT